MCPALLEISSTMCTSLLSSRISLSTCSMSVSQKFSPNPVWAIFMSTSLNNHKTAVRLMYAESFRECFCLQEVRAAMLPQSLARAGRIPSHDKHCHKIYNNSLGVCTLPINQYIVQKANFLLLEVLNLYFIFRM